MSEKRLIAIDAETVLQLHEIAIDLDAMNHHSGDRRGFDILHSILAAWDEGITTNEAELLSWAAEESAPYLSTKRERRRLCLADRKLTPLLPDPAPQEAE